MPINKILNIHSIWFMLYWLLITYGNDVQIHECYNIIDIFITKKKSHYSYEFHRK